jgi:signal transduction histidine kinase
MKLDLKVPVIILSLVIFTSEKSYTQSRYNDSLKQVLVNASGKERVNTLIEICNDFRGRDVDSAMKYGQLAFQIASKNGWIKEELLARAAIGTTLNTSSHHLKAKLQYDTVLMKSEQIGDAETKAMALAGMAAYENVKGNSEEALRHYFESLKLFESVGNKRHIARVFVGIGMLYQTMGQLSNAEKYLNKALETNRQAKDGEERTNLRALHTLANIKGMTGNYEAAIQLDSVGLQRSRASGNEYYASTFYDNIANCKMYSGNYAEAETYFRKCLLIDSSFGSKKQMADTYLNLGTLFLMQKKYATAINHLHHSINISRNSGFRDGLATAYLMISDVYRASGNSDSAYIYLNSSHQLKDSLMNEGTLEKIAELETSYQTEKKEQQIKLKNSEIRNKNYLIAGISGISLLSLFVLLGIYRRKQIKNKLALQAETMRQQEVATRAIIEAEETERKRIAAELHDGVGQMMSAARMNMSVFESDLQFKDERQKNSFENMLNLVDESCREIRNVSHQMMPLAIQKQGLKQALQTFIDKINRQIIHIDLHTENLNERMDSDTESLLYRIIQECVNNTLKHAEASRLDISVIRDAEGISATIEDNGKGFDINNLKDGIGLKNIRTRVAYLKGTVEIDSSIGNGTLVAIHVPLTS